MTAIKTPFRTLGRTGVVVATGVRLPCACGCGQMPKGRKSVFAQGHDTKHRSAFRAAHPRAAFRLITPAERRAISAEKQRALRAAKKVA